MVRKSTRTKRTKQQDTEESTTNTGRTRHSARIQARNELIATTKSGSSKRKITAIQNSSASSNTTSFNSIRDKRKRKKVNEECTETSNSQLNPTNVGYEKSSTTLSRNIVFKKPSITNVQETQVASSVVIQDTTVPQIISQRFKRGRPSKAALTVVLPAVDFELYIGSTLKKQSSKRGNNNLGEDHSLKLKYKRKKENTFTVPIPIRPQQIGQVYAIGSNDMSQCGIEGSDVKKLSNIHLEQFNIVDISAGALHSVALTFDGKVVTWGCNDHGTLGRFTEIPDSTEVKAILRSGNYVIGEEDKPTYAEGLDNVNIVKVACGDNITFAISDQGHLYATGIFKGKDGIIGFTYDNNIEQPIFTRYKPLEHLTIVDIAAGANHALALTREGEVYAWGSNEACSLGYNECELLVPFNMGLKHIVKLYAGAYHNFAIDDNGNIWAFGLNNMGQCGFDELKLTITPPEMNSFLKKVGQKAEEFAAGQHHTLARMHNGQVFSFGRSDSGQLGLGNNVIYKKRVTTPTVIPNLNPIKSIGTGDHFSMAVDIFNNIYAWGFGEFSVLGNNKDEDETSPFQIPDLNGLKEKDIVRISCGSSHALFLGV